ncbi:MAG TPA: helix-turn-helix domain-containing protein [Candidatus Sulfotelmatobacter sp.]|nr:helix-turn-helix domain-containing protein [Candidatus Sulfotelmatobacter sp.]
MYQQYLLHCLECSFVVLSTSRKLSDELNNAIKLFGDDHILCIVFSLRDGGLRFNEIQRTINGINPTTLADRLKKLEQEGIVVRKEET